MKYATHSYVARYSHTHPFGEVHNTLVFLQKCGDTRRILLLDELFEDPQDVSILMDTPPTFNKILSIPLYNALTRKLSLTLVGPRDEVRKELLPTCHIPLDFEEPYLHVNIWVGILTSVTELSESEVVEDILLMDPLRGTDLYKHFTKLATSPN